MAQAVQSSTLNVPGPPDSNPEILLRHAGAFTCISSLQKTLHIPKEVHLFFLCPPGSHSSPASADTLHVSGGEGSHHAGLVMDTPKKSDVCVHLKPFHTCIPLCQPVTLAGTATCTASQDSGLAGKRLGPSPAPPPLWHHPEHKMEGSRGHGKPGAWDALRGSAGCRASALAWPWQDTPRLPGSPLHAGGGE